MRYQDQRLDVERNATCARKMFRFFCWVRAQLLYIKYWANPPIRIERAWRRSRLLLPLFRSIDADFVLWYDRRSRFARRCWPNLSDRVSLCIAHTRMKLRQSEAEWKESSMSGASRATLNFATLTSVGLGGWYLGRFFEQRRCTSEKDSGTLVSPTTRICNMPALPLFGTVTAATPLSPIENKPEMGSKVSSTAARVSQVMEKHFDD